MDDQAVDLHTLVTAELAAHTEVTTDADRITVGGPSVALPATAAQVLGLALHELATNAVKHGALAQPAAKLQVRWDLELDDAPSRVTLEWRECGVVMPPPERLVEKGYGSHLIERALPYQLGAKTKIDFGPQGVRCAITVPINVTQSETRRG